MTAHWKFVAVEACAGRVHLNRFRFPRDENIGANDFDWLSQLTYRYKTSLSAVALFVLLSNGSLISTYQG